MEGTCLGSQNVASHVCSLWSILGALIHAGECVLEGVSEEVYPRYRVMARGPRFDPLAGAASTAGFRRQVAMDP